MLIVIVGFLSVYRILFSSSLFIEVSLDGLVCWGTAAITRDYPVVFTLYFFSLLGLVMGIVETLCIYYRSRIDFVKINEIVKLKKKN